ncbi:MAG TPA: GNAT family N-acetyltransferase [Candidatus Elarobacter sp.]
MPAEIRRREKLFAAVVAVFATLTPEDLRLRFGGGFGAEWLLNDLRANERHRAFVARDGTVPVAVVDVARGDLEIEIGVAVAPSHRRLGIAHRMVGRAMAEQDGSLPIVGYCLPENFAAAALLRRSGFSCTGRDTGYLRFVSAPRG